MDENDDMLSDNQIIFMFVITFLVILMLALNGCAGKPRDGINGVNGTNGVAGAQGAQGQQGVAGINGANALPCTVAQVPGGAIITCPDGSVASIANGSQGPVGLQGPKGDRGLQGLTGAVGAQGPAGIQGPAGRDCVEDKKDDDDSKHKHRK